jgi:hypothetical protein
MNGLAFTSRGFKQGERYLAEHVSTLLGSRPTTTTTEHSATEKVTERLENIRDVIKLMLAAAASTTLQTCVAETVIAAPQGIIREYLEGTGSLFKFVRGFFVPLVLIGVKLNCEASIGFGYLARGSTSFNA